MVGNAGGAVSAASRSTTLAVALVAAVATIAAGCGEKSEDVKGSPERVDLALDFYVNPDHVGIYQGIERGFFREAGLDVHPQVPSDPSAPIKQVAAGRADLAVSYEPEVLIARDQGLPVVAVGALVQQPLTSLISLPAAGIEQVKDLDGKRVATAGIPYQTAFLDAMLRDAGLSTDAVQEVDVGLNLLPAILSGRADAMLGGFKNIEGVDLQQRGKNPRVVPVDELGIPTYDELVVVANSDDLEENRDTIKLFLAALKRATQDAQSNPRGATQTILKANPDLDPKLTGAEVRATLPLLLPEQGRFGYMNASQWQDFAGFLYDEQVLDSRPDVRDALTNDLLSGKPA
jgi:putative hydroxymethylpyrimidine transport system substrate-binding protein